MEFQTEELFVLKIEKELPLDDGKVFYTGNDYPTRVTVPVGAIGKVERVSKSIMETPLYTMRFDEYNAIAWMKPEEMDKLA